MERLVLGEWVLDVDIEATKQYYKNLNLPSAESQGYRNFKAYLNQMTPDEKAFFESLGITPERCEVYSSRMDKACNYYFQGTHCIIGKYIHKPQMILWTPEELIENDFVDDRPDDRLYIGKFQFTFLDPDSPFWPIPPDSPPDSVCMMFSAEGIPWLLDEKCKEELILPPKWWQLRKKYKNMKQSQGLHIAYRQELIDRFIHVFKENGIRYRQMSKKNISDFVRRWFESFIPVSKRTEARKICFPNHKYGHYLWHAFSYELIPCEESDVAIEKYDSLERSGCYLYIINEKIGFAIENGSAFSSKHAANFSDLMIVDQAFQWTYVHTHEEYCGPYFKMKDKCNDF